MLIELDGTTGSNRRVFHLQQEPGTPHGDFITGCEHALVYGDAIDKRTGVTFQVGQEKSLVV
jgi:hypothetical protein